MLDPTNELAYKLLGCSILQLERSWFAVRLDGDKWVSEKQWVTDTLYGLRHLDWTMDLVSSPNSDLGKVTELWLFCPPSPMSPLGNTARLLITEPYTAFQFKLGHADSTGERGAVAHIIGHVTDNATGACTYYAWDAMIPALFEPMQTTVHDFHTWKTTHLPPTLGALALDVLGVKL